MSSACTAPPAKDLTLVRIASTAARAERIAEARVDLRLARAIRPGIGERELRGGVRLVEDDLAIAVLHHHRGGMPVLRGQQHNALALERAAARGGHQHEHRAAQKRAHGGDHRALTTNSVPRTPRTASGVCTVIASGDCFARRPDTTASVPRCSEASKRPALVVESNS